MDKYKKVVMEYAENHKDEILHNRGNGHALIIFQGIFKYARKNIRVAAKDWSNTELVNRPEFIEALCEYLDRSGAELKLLLSSEPSRVALMRLKNNVFKALFFHRAYGEGRVEIKVSDGKSFLKEGKPVHICTADTLMYRIEDDIEERQAICNFGDSKNTASLEERFDKIFQNTEIVRPFTLSEGLLS
ncbi:MAG: hypothetical protein IJN06_09815 [Bacteroidales bacterium]|nr:hypothetical protein [Bacteroidales bacterium]MBQ7019276.1 hypothetical protein [Bacteroidales bacterium]